MKKTLVLATIFAMLLPLASALAQEDEQNVLRGIERLSEMMRVIQETYREDLKATELVDRAISGMLNQLDPHSNYITAEQVRQLQSQQQGEYYGVGMTVGYRDGKVVCVQPQPGGPAAEAGIRAGDEIVFIDDVPTESYEYNENVERLRGPRGTSVEITVRRPGYDENMTFTVIRDRISLKSIPYAFMLDETTGYVRIDNFSHSTNIELEEQVLKLQRRGMEQLLLDLRSNPGGDLDASVAVADMFIDDGKLLYTKGLSGDILLEYKAEADTTLFRGPMVVLINSSSASGSEVVAGALQDHDRAWVVGEKSWGKGLVQTQYPLSYGAYLSLTTAKYYTPSGRLIQKPYKAGAFESYYNEDVETGFDQMDAATTDLGRIVYGGNGIMPDQVISSPEFSHSLEQVITRGYIFSFLNHMFSTDPEIPEDFYAGEETMQKMRSFLAERDIEYSDEQWQEDYPYLAARVTLDAHTRVRSEEYGFKMIVGQDSQLQEALQAFQKASDLLARRSAELDTQLDVRK